MNSGPMLVKKMGCDNESSVNFREWLILFHVLLCRYQQMLHRNLVYLATIADSNQNVQALLPVSTLDKITMATVTDKSVQHLFTNHTAGLDKRVTHLGLALFFWARFLSLAQSKLRLCSANYRAGYFSNLACDWLSIVWAYSEQESETGPWSALGLEEK